MSTRQINCPQCGSSLPIRLKYSKLVACEHCSSMIFLEDDAVRLAGKQSVMSEEPSLLELGRSFTYKTSSYLPVGHIRYSYGDGFWDEWWTVNNKGDGFWVTVDEGDYAFQKPMPVAKNLRLDHFKLQQKIDGRAFNKKETDHWTVYEIGSATCESFQGELPELIKIGETFDYVDLGQGDEKVLGLEFYPDEIRAYKGFWVDAFEIKVEQ